MARVKRKKGNPLLMRILVISVIAHLIALPIAAYYGAFKNPQRGPGESRIVMLANAAKASPEKEKLKEKAKKPESKRKSVPDSKGADKTKGNNLPQPKVVTSGPSGDGGGSESPTAESGTGTAGKLPETPNSPPKTETEVKKVPTTAPPVLAPKADPPKPNEPRPELPKPVAPKAVRLVEAEIIEAPQPEIPDELRSEPLDKTVVIEAEIDATGHPTLIKVSTSTGIKALDDLGLETAKKYRFKPATADGNSVEQRVRFRINFKVE